MKKFVIAAVAAAALTTTLSAESCASNFSGFYAGVQAGMNATVGTLKIDGFDASTGLGNAKSNIKTATGSKSFLGGLFAGYGMGVGSCAYVGGEIYGNFSNDDNKMLDSSEVERDGRFFNISAKNNLSLGAKIRLGYTVSPQAMIFLGLGMEYSKWQLKCENVQTNEPQTGIEKVTKKNKATYSFAPSVGMEMFMTKNVFVRGEYTYVVGTSQKLEPKQVINGGAQVTSTVKANMDQHRFLLGLGYKF
jgi:opacity protein-like surface antigen